MAYIEYERSLEDIYVRSTIRIDATNGYFTVGHKFLVIGKVNDHGKTVLQDAEGLSNKWGRTVLANRSDFEIITQG